ncbi:MAG: repeat protein [Gemmataceae bacterium]|nr:repeat protein [Gemmataceae bacterium]
MRPHFTRRRLLFAAVIGFGVLLVGAELYLMSPTVRKAAVDGAERIGADGYLVGRLSDHHTEVRLAASEALCRRGSTAVPALVAGLDDPHPGNRSTAAFILGRIGPAAGDAVPVLLRRATTDEDEDVREAAGRAVGRIGRDLPATVTELLAMLESADDPSRIAAVRAVGFVGDPRAVPPLIASLRHANAKVREEAADALGQMGAGSAPAIPALIEALDDPAPEVRGEAREAIEQLIRGGQVAVDADVVARVRAALATVGVRRVGPPSPGQ